MLNIFFIVLPVFAVIFIGKGLKKLNLINDNFIFTSNRLVYKLCLPVLLFYKISSSDILSVINIKTITIMYLSVFIIFIFSFIAAKIFAIKTETIGSLMMNGFRSNFAYLGLPVCYYAFGENGLLSASVLMAFIVPYVNMLSIIALALYQSKGKLSYIKNILINPLAVASILGMLISLMNVRLPAPLTKTLQIISEITLPLALFCIGGSLNTKIYGKKIKSISLSVLFKLIILPFIAYLLITIFDTTENILNKSMIILLSSPSATVNYILASTMGGDAEMTNGAIVISTVLSIFTFIFWLYILQ